MSQKLKETIILTAVYYGRDLKPEVLSMMAGDLNDLDAEKCVEAYTRYRRNPENKFFPLPAQIRELVNPEEFVSHEVKAREIAARIVGAIPKFGWCGAKEAQVYIGPEGWSVVQRQGGWSYICENMGTAINPTSFQAQVRDQVEGSLKYGLSALEQSIMALPEGRARTNDLESAGDVLKLITSKSPDGDGAA